MLATPTWDDQLWAATDDDSETPFALARTVLPPWAKEKGSQVGCARANRRAAQKANSQCDAAGVPGFTDWHGPFGFAICTPRYAKYE